MPVLGFPFPGEHLSLIFFWDAPFGTRETEQFSHRRVQFHSLEGGSHSGRDWAWQLIQNAALYNVMRAPP
jgi:hypothetical protein